MVEQITSGIKISVETFFEGTFYKNYKINFAFGIKAYYFVPPNVHFDALAKKYTNWLSKKSGVA